MVEGDGGTNEGGEGLTYNFRKYKNSRYDSGTKGTKAFLSS